MAVLRGARCCPNQDQVSIETLRPREGSDDAAARNALRGEINDARRSARLRHVRLGESGWRLREKIVLE
jgi:hypothetical protein